MLKYSENNKEFNLKDFLLDAVNTHNHNIHITTGFKPIDIINNIDDDIKNKVLENIEKSLKLNKKVYDEINAGNHILINKFVHKNGKKLVRAKFNTKNRILKIPATILEKYGGGILAINIDISTYEFQKNEQYIIDYDLCDLIKDGDWEKIMQESENNDLKVKEKTKKNKKYRKHVKDN